MVGLDGATVKTGFYHCWRLARPLAAARRLQMLRICAECGMPATPAKQAAMRCQMPLMPMLY